MTKKKMGYETPTTDLLVVRFERSLLQASNFGAKGAAGADAFYNEYDEDF